MSQTWIVDDWTAAKSLDLSPTLGSLGQVLRYLKQRQFGFQNRFVDLEKSKNVLQLRFEVRYTKLSIIRDEIAQW